MNQYLSLNNTSEWDLKRGSSGRSRCNPCAATLQRWAAGRDMGEGEFWSGRYHRVFLPRSGYRSSTLRNGHCVQRRRDSGRSTPGHLASPVTSSTYKRLKIFFWFKAAFGVLIFTMNTSLRLKKTFCAAYNSCLRPVKLKIKRQPEQTTITFSVIIAAIVESCWIQTATNVSLRADDKEISFV